MDGKQPKILNLFAIDITLLEPHPDAASFYTSQEDREALAESLDDVGFLDPVTVIEKEPGLPGVDAESTSGYWIVDGCGRVEAAREAGCTKIPCVVWDLGGMSVREYSVHRNTMGRRVTTGQRLLCYLSLHENAALDASGRLPGKPEGLMSSRDDISRRSLAERLGCSDRDASAALELFAAERAGDAGARDAYEGVLRGETPIRRWKAAAGGAGATAGKAKAKTDIGNLALRTFTSLRTVFAGWHEVAPDTRTAKYKKAFEAFQLMPEDIASIALEAIVELAKNNPRLKNVLRRVSESLD